MTSTTPPRVRSAHPDEADSLTDLISTAFFDLPPAQWLVPEPRERARVFPAYFAILVEHGLAAGRVDVIDDTDDGHGLPGRLVAAAIWWGGDDPGPPDYEKRLDAAAGPHRARFGTFDTLMEGAHPTSPHRYLGFAAVEPRRQQKGLGSALLRYRHAELDRTGQAAYLEASSERVRGLYRRHGYEPVGEPIALPEGPFMWPMWRSPAASASGE